ncbi:D-alanyl-D-alanine carboxypeptidase family protein [Streptomyces sp. WZ-12]|uniref:D-alanyl-D-alanine carboxypeptidase family protein n=1 Tax=Streptomyces sp. WZ-12 TaxID=3030210 RepID=UPI0023814D94|nr:D-alanyl-D-alanine carboxypeptidase [Streptomyces sp. WZ-12]
MPLRPLPLRPPPGRRLRHMLWWIAPTLLAMAAVIAVAVNGGPPGFTTGSRAEADQAGADSVPDFAAGLPWPDEGQTSLAVQGVQGIGNLGTRGAQTPVPIASVTKVMTAYVILRDHPLHGDEEGPAISADQQAADESVSGTESTAPVRAGRDYSQRQLLQLLLLPSGNNIARLLARWDAGSEEAFVVKMNQAASGLGMNRTAYTDASGIESTTVSTSQDQLKLAREAMKNDVFRKIVATPSATIPGSPGTVLNTNTLLRMPGVVGLKTGSSTPAGGNLVWAATARDDGRGPLVLGVVLHQQAGTSAEQGLHAALDRSEKLITAVRAGLTADARRSA